MLKVFKFFPAGISLGQLLFQLGETADRAGNLGAVALVEGRIGHRFASICSSRARAALHPAASREGMVASSALRPIASMAMLTR